MNSHLPPFVKMSSDIQFRQSRNAKYNIRVYLIPLMLLCIFVVFLGRLFQLTVVKGSYYEYIAENNRLREKSLEGKRGTIYDRLGIALATSEVKDSDSDEKYPAYTRTYSHNEALSHVLGYRAIASEKALQDDACPQPLSINDRIGAKGVEALYECELRPTKGKQLIEVDSMGDPIRTISLVEPKPGHPITLSIDSELQDRAYEVVTQNDIKTSINIDLREHNIAIVGLKPQTGETLMLFSYPTFDPQAFEDADPIVDTYFTDKRKPLFNRSILGTYPPGSVFKPMVALGALENKVIEPLDTITDNGYIEAGPQRFHNWFYTQYGRTDGEVDMRKGLQRSNDIYFYKIGELLGLDGIKEWSLNFGFGSSTGFPIDDAEGLIPSNFWKQEVIGEKWYLGDTYNMSIGQGYLLTTPMQIARAISVFANGGKLCKPKILKIDSEMNSQLFSDDYLEPECEDMHLDPENITVIREGMKEACEAGGTGWPLFDFNVEVNGETRHIETGCKTGTAESHAKSGLPHAWFTIFAPYDNPEIVLTVLVEESGEGSYVAAPIAKEILKTYFERQ